MEIEDIKSSIIVTLANNDVECEDYLDFTATTDTITSRKDQDYIMTPDTISSHIEEVVGGGRGASANGRRGRGCGGRRLSAVRRRKIFFFMSQPDLVTAGQT